MFLSVRQNATKYSSDRCTCFYVQNLICFMNYVSLVVLGSVKLNKFEQNSFCSDYANPTRGCES